jgi:hypothetical protein
MFLLKITRFFVSIFFIISCIVILICLLLVGINIFDNSINNIIDEKILFTFSTQVIFEIFGIITTFLFLCIIFGMLIALINNRIQWRKDHEKLSSCHGRTQ